MRQMFYLFLMLFAFLFQGCASKYTDDTLPEKKLSAIQINTQIPIKLKNLMLKRPTMEMVRRIFPNMHENFRDTVLTTLEEQHSKGQMGNAFDDLPLEELNDAMKIAFSKSQYFALEKNSKIYTIEAEFNPYYKQEGHIGQAIYWLSLGVLPGRTFESKHGIEFRVYDESQKLIKKYNYEESYGVILTVYTPLPLFFGQFDGAFSASLMDKFVSNLVADLEKDEVMTYSDSKHI